MTSARHPADLLGPIDYTSVAPPSLLNPPPVAVLPGARSHLGVLVAHPIGWRGLRLDLHLPAHSSGPFPLVVYAHGGSFVAGLPAMGPWHTLPSQGIAVASVDYRLAGEVRFPEPVEDIRAAVRWVRAHAEEYDLDPERVAGWGSSAGGYLMVMAGLAADDEALGRPVSDLPTSSRLSAVVDHYAGANFAGLRRDAHPATPPEGLAVTEELVRLFLGFDPATDEARRRTSDPLGLADRNPSPPPFLIMHGDADTRVGLGQSRWLHDGLIARGVESELVVVPGAEHAGPEFAEPDRVAQVIRFLREHW